MALPFSKSVISGTSPSNWKVVVIEMDHSNIGGYRYDTENEALGYKYDAKNANPKRR